MSYQYYDKWYDKNNTPYNTKKRETTMSIRDAPQEKVGKAHKKTTNERGRPGNPDVTPTDDFKIKEIQSFEKYMEMAVLPVVKTDTSIKQLNAWLDQTDSTNP